MEVIALGKFENKLSEAGVIGGSAKQELLGVIFSPTFQPTKTHKRTPEISPLFLLKKVLPAPLPTFANPQIVFSPTGLWSRLEWPGVQRKLLKHLPPCSKRYFPAPLPTFASPQIIFPLPHNQQASLEWTGVAALHAGKKLGTEWHSLS